MPEGDTILRIKHRLDQALVGQRLAVSTPSPRGQLSGVERLDGEVLDRVDTHGKNLMLRFGDLTVHSHLAMTGSWDVHAGGARWRQPRSHAWVLLRGAQHEAVQFNGPTLRLLSAGRLLIDPQLSRLGPDILAPEFDPGRVLKRSRAGDQTRTLGNLLLDQRLLAGIGNIFKNEACFATALDPWRRLSDTSDEQLVAVLCSAREQMLEAVTHGRRPFAVYGHRGPCSRCGGHVQSGAQGDANRTTWWCESCQR